MKRILCLLILLAGTALQAEEVSFSAADGLTVFADWHAVQETGSAPTIVLFHQAGGSARGEYPEIIDRLRGLGYQVLAVDQRAGGDRFGIGNRTVDALPAGQSFGYCEAYPDLLAALEFAAGRSTGPLAVWGSSYSAGLVITLAAAAAERIDAALAFSPASGGPMADCNPMESLPAVSRPLVVFRPASEMKVPSVIEQAAQFKAAGVSVQVVDGGVHGSSMLVAERSQADLTGTWRIVEDFLRRHLKGAGR